METYCRKLTQPKIKTVLFVSVSKHDIENNIPLLRSIPLTTKIFKNK